MSLNCMREFNFISSKRNSMSIEWVILVLNVEIKSIYFKKKKKNNGRQDNGQSNEQFYAVKWIELKFSHLYWCELLNNFFHVKYCEGCSTFNVKLLIILNFNLKLLIILTSCLEADSNFSSSVSLDHSNIDSSSFNKHSEFSMLIYRRQSKNFLLSISFLL